MNSKRKHFWGNNPRYKVPKTSCSNNNNRFSCLSDLDESDDSSIIMEEERSVVLEAKIPPIVVDKCHNFCSIMKLFGSKCYYKRMSIGTKLVPTSLQDYDDIIKVLKEKFMKFYTHPVNDRKSFKLSLFGLPKLEIPEITDEFKTRYNIQLMKINEIKTSRTGPDDALYVLEFDRSQISKKEVRKIKHVCGVIVHWKSPKKRTSGPTQCSKCAMFGHGSANCFRSNACLSCGGPHDYSVCQLQKLSPDDAVVHKCFNCANRNLKNLNHRADDPRCPCRKEYLEIRQKVTAKRQPNRVSTQPEYIVSNDDFPSTSRQASVRPPSWPNIGLARSKLQATNASHHVADNDLSNEKILEIFFEAIDALEKCRNKYDKMRVLGNMLRYVI